MGRDKTRTVWSSDEGDMRGAREGPDGTRSLPPGEQTAYLHREAKGRAGKTVTLIRNLVLSEEDLRALAKELKRACGSGGTISEGVIEIQGEHRGRIAETLKKLGYRAKIAGG